MAVAGDDLRSQRAAAYESVRHDVQALVPTDAQNILELGCSSGAFGAAIKDRQGAYVLGVELSQAYAADARARLDEVFQGSVEEFLAGEKPSSAPFDCLVAADILEHLVDPWTALREASALLRPGATVVLSVPNVLWGRGLWRVVRTGRWPRDAKGVFDATHLRWFGLEDALELVRQANLEPQAVLPSFWSTGIRLHAKRSVLWRTPVRRFLAVQYLVTAKKPSVI